MARSRQKKATVSATEKAMEALSLAALALFMKEGLRPTAMEVLRNPRGDVVAFRCLERRARGDAGRRDLDREPRTPADLKGL